MSRLPKVLLAAVFALAAASPTATRAASLTGGDPCALIELMPGPHDPLLKTSPFGRTLRRLGRAGSNPARLRAIHRRLLTELGGLLGRATRIFAYDQHPKHGDTPWNDRDRKRARTFLRRYVLARHPALVIGHFGFEPVPGLRAALMWTACRGGNSEAAIRYGRRATTAAEAPSRAFAALLLLARGRRAEALELAPSLGGDSFIVAWVHAELARDPSVMAHFHAIALRRVSTPAEHRAALVQAERMASRAKGAAKGPRQNKSVAPSTPRHPAGRAGPRARSVP